MPLDNAVPDVSDNIGKVAACYVCVFLLIPATKIKN
jgi:hypothetical protein